MLCISSFFSLVWVAVCSNECAAASSHLFYEVQEGYIKFSELLVASLSFSDAKAKCSELAGCVAFWHKGDASTDATDVSQEMHFNSEKLITINHDTKYTTYVKRITCSATQFDHCPTFGDVRCCDTRLSIPQCGRNLDDCQTLAEETHCLESESVCPTLKGKTCCDRHSGRCTLTDKCPRSVSLLVWVALSLVVIGIVLGVLGYCAIQRQQRQEQDCDEDIVVGALVTVHQSDPPTAGVVTGWDERTSCWRVKTREGRVLSVQESDLVLIQRPGVEMQTPLAHGS